MKKIFIVHGWTYSKYKWAALINILGAKGYNIQALNVPGLTEATDKVWTLNEYVNWLNDKLQNESEPILIGHSNGGRIALAFAAQYPSKLKYLILIDSAGIFHNEYPIRIKRLVFGLAAKIGKKITSSGVLRNLLYRMAGENDYKNAPPQMRQTMANLISIDLTDRLYQITAPTIIIWGNNDNMTPLSDGQLMHRLIKNSRFHAIQDAGHSPHFTHAKQVAEKILEEIAL